MQLPLSQLRHSNVAVVRLTRNGVRLEIACYKNKVQSFRAGLETRLDEVLQIDRVFTNVSRGSYASSTDIKKALGTDATEQAALKYILEHGDLQVAQQERSSEQTEVIKDIATVISQRCVHAVTKRPFPTSIIEQALRTIGAVIKPDQPVKKQALQLTHRLIEANVLPIQRAMMKLRATMSSSDQVASLVQWCKDNGAEIISDSPAPLQAPVSSAAEEVVSETGVSAKTETVQTVATADPTSSLTLLFLLAPQLFRDADVFVKSQCSTNSLHVIETAVAETGEAVAADFEAILQHQSACPSSDGTCGVSTQSATSSGAVPATVHAKQREASVLKKPKQVSKGRHEEDSSESDNVDASLTKAKPTGKAVVLTNASDSDSDDNDKRKKKKKAAKQKQPSAAMPKPAQPKPSVPDDSDEELVSERKKKKQHAVAAAVNSNHEIDDEEFDYGEEGEDL